MAPRGDQVAQFFAVYTGWVGGDFKPVPSYYDNWTDDGLIAGTSTYRPPVAAYILARDMTWAGQHVFSHGDRTPIPHGDPHPDGGVEIYCRSPSFLLSAGGQFLNSGYGGDQFSIPGVVKANAHTPAPRRPRCYRPGPTRGSRT